MDLFSSEERSKLQPDFEIEVYDQKKKKKFVSEELVTQYPMKEEEGSDDFVLRLRC